MSLDQKYNIPRETIKNMVADGVISCSVARQHEIYDYYLQYMSSGKGKGKSQSEVFFDISLDLKVSESWVKAIYYKLGTK